MTILCFQLCEVFIDKQDGSANLPDLPGVAVAGASQEETRELMRIAIPLHIKGLIEDGQPLPQPNASEYIEVIAA
jgi:predicted RNase H-like HicB family nuclease